MQDALFSKVSGDTKYDTTHSKDWSLDIAQVKTLQIKLALVVNQVSNCPV